MMNISMDGATLARGYGYIVPHMAQTHKLSYCLILRVNKRKITIIIEIWLIILSANDLLFYEIVYHEDIFKSAFILTEKLNLLGFDEI